MRRICWLRTRTARRLAVAGGKGASLAALRARGFDVPDAFIVTSRGFREFAAGAGVDPRALLLEGAAREAARLRISSAAFPQPLAGAVRGAVRALGGRLAVRSSYGDEDGSERSFAGQLESVLDVEGEEACLDAVRRVYASAFTPSLASYAPARDPEAHSPCLAVVVQRMLTPLAAGVAFSVDPVTREPRVVVEAVPGVAENLLRGAVTPARFVIDPGGAFTHVDRTVLGEGRLPEAILLDLAALVRRLAADAGRDQDVEWAWDGSRLWLLQARPITTVGGRLYSRRLVGDMAPGLIRPLLWSTHYRGMNRRVFGRLFTELLGPTPVDFATLTRRFHSRMYADMTMFGDLLERAGLPRNFFEAMTRHDRIARHPPITWRLVRRLPRAARLGWRYARASASIERFLERHEREMGPLRGADWSGEGVEALLAGVDQLMDLHGASQWHTFLAAMNMAVRARLLQRVAERHAPGVPSAALVGGQPGLKGLEPNRELRRLAADPAWSAAVPIALLSSGHDATIRLALAASPDGAHLRAEVEAFLERFGYLAANGTDFTEPRWAEAPGPVWQALARHIEANRQASAEPEAPPSSAERDRLRAEVRARVGFIARPWFDALVRSTARYIELRERASATMTEDAYHARRLFLAIGERLAARGDLRDRDAVFLLYYDELKALVEGRLPGAAELAARRAAELSADAAVEPAESFRGDYPASSPCEEDARKVLCGIPGSAGLVSGYARVVRDPSDAPASLSRSDVLVVPFTDIGWSPLLALVGGVVAECGGQLSHTAIIAREYGLPTVVSVSHATRLIREGEPITVDGTRGRVYLDVLNGQSHCE